MIGDGTIQIKLEFFSQFDVYMRVLVRLKNTINWTVTRGCGIVWLADRNSAIWSN